MTRDNCVHITQNLDMTYYPLLVVIFLLYIIYDIRTFKHTKRKDYEKMRYEILSQAGE